MNYLEVVSSFFIAIGIFFVMGSFSGFSKYKNFFIKVHAANMFSIYGANFIFLAIGILSFRPVIFFEICGIVILNTLSAIAVTHCLVRNAILSGVECVAKSRDEVLKMKEKEKNEFYETLRERNKKKEEKIKQKEEIKKKKVREKEELDKIKKEEKIRLKEEKTWRDEEKKQDKKKDKDVKTSATASKFTQKAKSEDRPVATASKGEPKLVAATTTSATDKAGIKPEQKDIEKENDELKEKIREQKKILRKKLETIRRNAFITRKPEEIEKAEKLIKDILSKHNLTEDMLKDDDE
jgi:multisubunit Na+/H+ antiporter MnhG subunit